MSDFCGVLTSESGLRMVGQSGAEHCGCQVLVRGYIADRRQLGERLGLDAALAQSDALLLALAYRRWGQAVQAHVHGEYAAVIFDPGAGTALLTHDALGLVQLFYAEREDGLAFATDLVDLAAEDSGGDLSADYMADFLVFGFITGAETPFSSIRRLLPGASIRWSAGRTETLRTWDLDEVAPLRHKSNEEYEEHFRALFRTGVQASIDPQGPTWISLSGGLDSSSIACAAAGLNGTDLAAFSVICTTWPEADERSWMRAVVDRCNLPWHTLELEDVLPFAALPGGAYSEPTQAVADEARLQAQNGLLGAHGARVMLTGHAGDAVLCASPGAVPHHLADPLFDGRPLDAVRAVLDWRRGTRTGRSYTFWMLRGLIEPALRHKRGRRLSGINLRRPLPPWLQADYADAMELEQRVHRQVAPRCRTPGRQALWHELWVLAMATATVPRRRMGFAVRNPILYLPLVEFMAAIPWEQKLRPGCDRYLQRRALAGILPEAVRQRTDKGNGNPALVEGLRRSRDWVPYLCDRSILAEQGIVDLPSWRGAVRQASVGQTYDDKLFLATMALEVWLRQWADPRERPRRPPTGFDTTAQPVLDGQGSGPAARAAPRLNVRVGSGH